jgi:predicted MFS family arabinose efflux permease
MMSAQTLVLEFGAREDIPMRLAISTTAETSVAAVGPLIGGIVATSFGFATLIGVSIALLVVALAVLLFLVGDPRHSR